jgi:AcrR family transcriptional regulator
MARTGRRRGDSGTREAILEAARAAFAAGGYDRTTIRAVAREAGVDPALIHHFYGTKERLFSEALRLPVDPAAAAETILAEGVDSAGDRLVRFFLSIWEPSESRGAFLAVVRSALTNEEAARMLREFVERAIVLRVATAIGGRDASLRASLAGAHLVGMAVLRYVVRVEPLASASPERVAALVGPRIQSYLTP